MTNGSHARTLTYAWNLLPDSGRTSTKINHLPRKSDIWPVAVVIEVVQLGGKFHRKTTNTVS